MILSFEKYVIIRLCFTLTFFIDVFNFPLVSSDSVQLNNTEKISNTNLISDKPIVISLKNLKQDKNNSLSLNEEIIENMTVLDPLQIVSVVITDIPSEIHFIITEVHSYLYDVTLGYQPHKTDPQSYITGTNIGLVNITDEVKLTNVTLYIENNNANKVTALIAVTAYNRSAPIPGGCNMEFQTEIAPYLVLNYTDSFITVLSQPSAMPPTSINKRKSCQIPPGTLLRYDTYHMYLPEGDFSGDTYFSSIRSMINVEGIQTNGKKVPPSLVGPQNKRLFSSFIGTGSIFAIVVSTLASADVNGNIILTSAAYVPALTYGCSPAEASYSCHLFTSSVFELIFIGLLVVGLFLILLGHVYFKTELFIYGALTFGPVTYVLLILHGDFTPGVDTGLSALSSLIGGLFWVKIWSIFGIPVVSVLLPLLNAGFLVSALLAYFLGNLDPVQQIVQSDANFWLAILCITLSVTLLLISDARDGSIRSNAFVGGYMIIISLDYFIGSNLKYIIINIYRRLMIPEFSAAVVDPPLQTRDIVLSVLWIVLIGIGCITQETLLEGKPPFPPPNNPFHHRVDNDYRYGYTVIPNDSPGQEDSEGSEDYERRGENTPLVW